MDGGDALFDK